MNDYCVQIPVATSSGSEINSRLRRPQIEVSEGGCGSRSHAAHSEGTRAIWAYKQGKHTFFLSVGVINNFKRSSPLYFFVFFISLSLS